MSEASRTAPIIETVGGTEVSFPRLRMRQYEEIAEKYLADRKADARRNADDCKLSPKEKFAIVAEIDQISVNQGMLDYYLQTPKGCRCALRASLAMDSKSQSEADALIDQIDPVDAVYLARRLVGFVVGKEEPSPLA